jgi:hypothetical protein
LALSRVERKGPQHPTPFLDREVSVRLDEHPVLPVIVVPLEEGNQTIDQLPDGIQVPAGESRLQVAQGFSQALVIHFKGFHASLLDCS